MHPGKQLTSHSKHSSASVEEQQINARNMVRGLGATRMVVSFTVNERR